MGAKKDEYYARLAEARKLGNYDDPVLKELLQAATAEEQAEREADEDAYYEGFNFLDEYPIGHPRLCGLGGCVVGEEDNSE
ncbi:MAG: hypothetical protein M0Q92_16215 [Methanoregula sp.]|jgi:hypothetical protein|nr:hypothetical protein [Methanoregula sp.]